jgi:hypothetical protein
VRRGRSQFIPHGRFAVLKLRSFVDFAMPRLRALFEELGRAIDVD